MGQIDSFCEMVVRAIHCGADEITFVLKFTLRFQNEITRYRNSRIYNRIKNIIAAIYRQCRIDL